MIPSFLAGRNGWTSSERWQLSGYILTALIVSFVPLSIHFGSNNSVSLSSDVGYDNRVGALLILICSIVYAGVLYWRDNCARNAKLLEPLSRTTEVSRSEVTIGDWLLSIAVFTLVIVVAGLLVDRAPYVAEAGYFLKRIDRVIAHARPYTEFEFSYGPALLYLPLCFHNLFRTSLLNSYLLSLILLQWSGPQN